MTGLPPDAVKAAARALYDLAGGDPERWPDAYAGPAGWRGMGEAALAAALPAIRRHIADEIDLARYGFGGCTDEYLEGMRMGARVARGGSDADL